MGVCLFFMIEISFSSASMNPHGYNSNLQIVSINIYSAIIVLDTLKLSMQVKHWTKLLLFSIILLSLAPYLGFIWFLNYQLNRPVERAVTMCFTSFKSYLGVLLMALVLLTINGVLVYGRFHSQWILNKMMIALS